MQSTNIRQIKAALWEQAFLGGTQVSCPMRPVVAIRRRKGQPLAMMCGWGRWCPVEHVRIEGTGDRLHKSGGEDHTPGGVLARSLMDLRRGMKLLFDRLEQCLEIERLLNHHEIPLGDGLLLFSTHGHQKEHRNRVKSLHRTELVLEV